MVHELLGLTNNRVDLGAITHVPKDLRELVLSPDQDDFYRDTMCDRRVTNPSFPSRLTLFPPDTGITRYDNFGDLGDKLSVIMSDFQKKTTQDMRVESITDMQRFVDAYPEFRKLKSNVAKHITLTSELSRIVEERYLMEVSALEQELACQHKHAEALRKVRYHLAF